MKFKRYLQHPGVHLACWFVFILIFSWAGNPIRLFVVSVLPKTVLLNLILLFLCGFSAWVLFFRASAFRSSAEGSVLVFRPMFWLVWVLSLSFFLRLDLPQEQIHFFLFGVCGLLAARALPRVWAIPLVITLGLADELWQGLLPDRYFDWRDVGFNAWAGVLGVMAASTPERLRSVSSKDASQSHGGS